MLPIAIDAMETIYEATDYAPYLSDFAEEGCSWKYALCIEYWSTGSQPTVH